MCDIGLLKPVGFRKDHERKKDGARRTTETRKVKAIQDPKSTQVRVWQKELRVQAQNTKGSEHQAARIGCFTIRAIEFQPAYLQ